MDDLKAIQEILLYEAIDIDKFIELCRRHLDETHNRVNIGVGLAQRINKIQPVFEESNEMDEKTVTDFIADAQRIVDEQLETQTVLIDFGNTLEFTQDDCNQSISKAIESMIVKNKKAFQKLNEAIQMIS